jgi:hypothetical protein
MDNTNFAIFLNLKHILKALFLTMVYYQKAKNLN